MLLFSLLAFCVRNSFAEATSIDTLKSSSTPLFKSSTIATRSSSGVPSTITTGPITTSPIAINTCSYYNETESRTLWNDPWCSMYAGMVDLVYWPTDNKSYPSTFYDDKYDYTYSSPSVYMVVNTLYGWNPCGLLGPSTSREVFAFDLTEVSTLVPYTQSTDTARQGTRQLHLSDLGVHCSTSYNKTELATQTHPMKADDTRCNPFLVVPPAVKRYGYPYWLHCGVVNNKFGLFDPPYAIPPVDDLVPTEPTTTTAPADASETENTTAATSASTKATAPTNPEATESAITTAGPVNTSSSDGSPETTDPATADPGSTSSNDASNSAGGDAVIANPGNTEPAAANPGNPQTSPGAPVGDGNSQPTATTDAPYTTVTGVEGQFDPTDYTDGVVSTTSKQVARLGTGGLEIVNPDTGITITSVYSNTVPTTVVYSGQALTLGGPAVTVTNVVGVSPDAANPTGATDAAGSGANTDGVLSKTSKQVVSLGAGGLEVANPDTGITITSVYGNTVPTTVVYSGQTLTLGGPAVTVTSVVGVSPDAANPTGASNVVGISLGSANPTGASNVVGISLGSANQSSGTTAAGSGSTPIATPSAVPNSSANKISGGVVGLLLALMTSIWV